MNRKELDLEAMIESVVECLDSNEALINNRPTILQTRDKLKVNITAVNSLKLKQAVSTKPDYAIKSNRKSDLIANMINVQTGVAAVAAEKDDVSLKLVSNFTEVALNNMRESDLVLKAQELYAAALTIKPELLFWGVSEDEIEALGNSANSFLGQNPTIRNKKAKSTRATTEIKDYVNDSYTIIKDKLDPLMATYKKTNPTFYGEYQNTRIIVSRAATHAKPEEQTPEAK